MATTSSGAPRAHKLVGKNGEPGSLSEAALRKEKYHKCSNTNDLPLAIHYGDSDGNSARSVHHASDTPVLGYY